MMTEASTPMVGPEKDLVVDDIHSFVLRIGLNRTEDGRPRPQYRLQHVNTDSTSWLNSLEEVLERLESQVRGILHQAEQVRSNGSDS